MKPVRTIAALILGLVVSGCAAVDTPSRNAPFDATAQAFGLSASGGDQSNGAIPVGAVRVVDLNVSVPQSLIVSEENSYYPAGDIVWRGEPAGDRHRQIQRIFEEGFTRGTTGLAGPVPVVLDVTVERFHSVTEKTRYTFGGIHSIRFVLAVRHAETGLPIAAPKTIKANLKAFGGQRAVNAERQGQTQRVRIVAHLSEVIQSELGRPPRSESDVAGLVLEDTAGL